VTVQNATSAGLEKTAAKLVNAKTLLELLWDEDSRPSLRWLRTQTKAKALPFVRMGHLIFFYPPDVRSALDRKYTIRARGESTRNGGAQ
jgi:hypothetical protein